MPDAKRKRLKGRIRRVARVLSLAGTKVSLGGEWDFPPDLASSLEDMWAYEKFEGSEFQGIRLVREMT